MGIQKDKTLPNTAQGNYWGILDMAVDTRALKIKARIALFKDKATFDALLPALGGLKSFAFSYTMQEVAAAPNLVAYVYGKLLAIANQDVSVDLSGRPIDPPVKRDPDIAGGTVVA